MANKLSHTIRFDQEEKATIAEIGKQNGRGFQAQVEFMLQEQLRNQMIALFLRSVECALLNLTAEEREETMAKIAKVVGLEQE